MASKTINKPNSPIKFQRFLLNHQFKKVGFFIASLSFVFLFINAFLIESAELKFLTKNGLLVGMLLISISKEDIEDELISNLRMQSFTLAFIFGVLLSLCQPYLDFLVDSIFNPGQATLKETGDFLILWVLLCTKVFYFEFIKRCYK